jgi:actin related protein 2/3 complex subunit 5
MADFNWRTLNIDALDPESSYNFDLATLTPAVQPVSTEDVQTLSGQIKQLMRAGQAEEALKGALENPPYGADEQGKVRQARAHQYHSTEETECGLQHSARMIAKEFLVLQNVHLSTVTEILQSIRQSEMTPILQRIYQSEGGSEVCDTLMKYLYKGMGQSQPAAAATASAGKGLAPQQGFTQVAGRSFGGAEGGGQAMSVLLSWHEKVSVCTGLWLEMLRANFCLSLWKWLVREAL